MLEVAAVRRRETPARSHDIAYQFGALGPHRLEPNRLLLAIQMTRDVNQVDRLLDHTAFACLHEHFHEMPEAESFEIAHDTCLFRNVSRMRAVAILPAPVLGRGTCDISMRFGDLYPPIKFRQ